MKANGVIISLMEMGRKNLQRVPMKGFSGKVKRKVEGSLNLEILS
jgi:hypothetical protein